SLAEASAIDARLAARAAELERAGFAIQVPRRPETTLAFFHLEATGPRHRLRSVDPSTFAMGEQHFDLASLRALLREDPLRFSTSAPPRSGGAGLAPPKGVLGGGPGGVRFFGAATRVFPVFRPKPAADRAPPPFSALSPAGAALARSAPSHPF